MPFTDKPDYAGAANEALSWEERQKYKGFRAPAGMSPDQEGRWKAAIDEQTAPTIPEAPGAFATKSLGDPSGMPPPTTGDPALDPDAPRALMEAGSMLPVGQVAQAGADVGVAGMDLSKGDYLGAGISAAAVGLPISARMLKGVVKPAMAAGAKTTEEVMDAARQWKEKGTDSPYFRGWFGDSKAVHQDGEVLTLYHGTSSDFDAFKPSARGMSGRGIYFATTPKQASQYTGPTDLWRGGNIIPVHLRIENPLFMEEFASPDEIKRWIKAIDEVRGKGEGKKIFKKFEEREQKRRMNKMLDPLFDPHLVSQEPLRILNREIYNNAGARWATSGDRFGQGPESAQEIAKLAGYDSVIRTSAEGWRSNPIGRTREVVVFDPEQAKSIHNIGTFSEDPRMLYGVGAPAAIAMREKAREEEGE